MLDPVTLHKKAVVVVVAATEVAAVAADPSASFWQRWDNLFCAEFVTCKLWAWSQEFVSPAYELKEQCRFYPFSFFGVFPYESREAQGMNQALPTPAGNETKVRPVHRKKHNLAKLS